MSDEMNEKEVTNAADIEMAATPLGSSKGESAETTPVAQEQEQKPAAPPKEEQGASVDYSRTFRELTEGDVVGGVVVHIDK